MEKGSLIKLARPLSKKDWELTEALGVQLPESNVFYVVSKGPILMYCHIQKKSSLAIQIEELGTGFYHPSFFIEVQKPMKVDLNQILAT